MRPFKSTLTKTNPALILRALAIFFMLLCPLLPDVERHSDRSSVVFVLDQSASVSASLREQAIELVTSAAAQAGETELGAVVFDTEASLVVPVGGDMAMLHELETSPLAQGTDIEEALELAIAALPREGHRRIVLLSDGHGTGGDEEQALLRARDQGIVVDTMSIGSDSPREATVTQVTIEQARVTEGEPVTAIAQVSGPPGQRVPLWWSRDGIYQRSADVQLDDQGQGSARYLDLSGTRGRHIYSARAALEGEPGLARQALALVDGRPRILIITSTGERPNLLLDALDHAGAEVATHSMTSGQPRPEDLVDVDLVILADVAIASRGEVSLLAGLNEAGQETLLNYVSERGGGLIALGGIFGFGPEYRDQQIARLFPVEIEDLGEIEDPSVAMAVMLDRSGSMGAFVGQHSKLDLAIEAALAAAGSLRTHDRVAIGATDERTTWFQRLGYISELMRRREQIRSMGPGGGGIFVYTSLSDAYEVLRAAREPVRHVLLFSDTADSEEQCLGTIYGRCPPGSQTAEELAQMARAAGITTSVVGIGSSSDRDTHFLRRLAAAGGGRLYITSAATDLRRIFVSETRAATRSSLREEHLELSVLGRHPILDGVDLSQIPAIEGFVQTGRRATADTLLATPSGRPVLATWRYGLGTVVAWTTDGGQRWTSEWSDWEGAGQLMRQMVRFALRRNSGYGIESRVAYRDGHLEVTVEAPPSEEGSLPDQIEIQGLSASETSTLTAELLHIAPGQWVARAPFAAGERPDFAVARVLDDEGTLLTEAIGSSNDERELVALTLGPDEAMLRDLAQRGGGVYQPSAAQMLRVDGPSAPAPRATWPFALLLAALLVCLDVWLRRSRRAGRKAITAFQVAPKAAKQEEPRSVLTPPTTKPQLPHQSWTQEPAISEQ